jgi:hypothetical protein
MSERRGFDCPMTEEKCENRHCKLDPDSKRVLCAEQKAWETRAQQFAAMRAQSSPARNSEQGGRPLTIKQMVKIIYDQDPKLWRTIAKAAMAGDSGAEKLADEIIQEILR